MWHNKKKKRYYVITVAFVFLTGNIERKKRVYSAIQIGFRDKTSVIQFVGDKNNRCLTVL